MVPTTRVTMRLAAVVAVLAIALAGCSASSMEPRQPTGVWGYVAADKNAGIELDTSGSSVVSLVAKRVVSPVAGLLVVTAADPKSDADKIVGIAPVGRGVTTGVRVPLGDVSTRKVTATLYADKGRLGKLDVDSADPATSPDRPIFVRGKPVAAALAFPGVPGAGVEGAAIIDVYDQTPAAAIAVTHVRAPAPSWVVVYTDVKGKPGTVLARRSIPATDALNFSVPLGSVSPTGTVWVGLNVDAGALGTFEYSRSAPATSTPDQPYRVGGAEVIRRIAIR